MGLTKTEGYAIVLGFSSNFTAVWIELFLVCVDYNQCVTYMVDIKKISNVIPLTSKITEHKLNGSNYYDWRQTILFYFRSVDMDGHMTKDPLEDRKWKKDWLRDVARLYL